MVLLWPYDKYIKKIILQINKIKPEHGWDWQRKNTWFAENTGLKTVTRGCLISEQNQWFTITNQQDRACGCWEGTVKSIVSSGLALAEWEYN